jgi:hypothetical protein
MKISGLHLEETMKLIERQIEIEASDLRENTLFRLEKIVQKKVDRNEHPIRFVVTKSEANRFQAELGILECDSLENNITPTSIFEFRKRTFAQQEKFNVVLVIPTGIGAELGGHSGDGGALARFVAASCDTLITHPNVVNASDINELPENGLYVEGSVISRFMMGAVGLQKVRANRILVVIGEHEEEYFTQSAINSLGAALVTLGITCPEIVVLSQLKKKLEMITTFSPSGRAAGEVLNFNVLCDILDSRSDAFDAVAIASQIQTDHKYREGYFFENALNPWGGVEAMLTHALSLLFNVPSAHSPMTESKEILVNFDVGIVEPRKSAEAVSVSNFHCVLKGLQRSPRIVPLNTGNLRSDVLMAEDINCLVIPDRCIGLPTLAALEQGIPVIAVRENKNIMANDLTALPWKEGQLFIVENYWEAVGVLNALKSGVAPHSVRRPIDPVPITYHEDNPTNEHQTAVDTQSHRNQMV